MSEQKTLTDMQIVFLRGKQRLKQIEEAAEERGEYTLQEELDRDYIMTKLLEAVMRYGIKRARDRMSGYRLSGDAYADVRQDLATMFYAHFKDYDPMRTTPLTYFSRYFDEVISVYLQKYSQNLSQYDANNVARVRAAIRYYEASGVQWDIFMLANRTGLSPKIVKQTLHIAENSKRANIDDLIQVASKMPTPEEKYISQECTEAIIFALKNVLSDEERRVFLCRVNLEEKQPKPWNQAAEETGLPVRRVKSIFSEASAKLASCKYLRAYRENYNPAEDPDLKINRLSFSDPSVAKKAEKQLAELLGL